MGKIKDKYNNWKIQKVTKFRDQSMSSKKSTQNDAKDIADCYNDNTKLESADLIFRQSWHQKGLKICKKINFITLCTIQLCLIVLMIFFGLFKNLYLIDPLTTPISQYESVNKSAWLGLFISFLSAGIIYTIYLIPTITLKSIRYNKFKTKYLYQNTFQDKGAMRIIILILMCSLFICFSPFRFIPLYVLSFLNFNTGSKAALIIMSIIFNSIMFVAYLGQIVTYIICHVCNPKVNVTTNLKKV